MNTTDDIKDVKKDNATTQPTTKTTAPKVILEYDVVINTSIRELIDNVNKNLKHGYQPVGGICAGGNCFYQAMIRMRQV